MKPDKSKIRKRANTLLDEGKSRQETFDLMVEEYGHPLLVADVLKHLIAQSTWNKYKVHNLLLLLALIGALVYKLRINFNLITIGIYGSFIFIVILRYTRQYFWIPVYHGLTLGSLFVGAWFNSPASRLPVNQAVILVLALPLIALPWWLNTKLSPKPEETRETYINNKGQKRSRINFKFPD
ncbi:MAG: hypothetical protein JJ975_03220 [Bacteroidia bacterium]|nr:hypothetical protein [Bacteroidia bacterium]